AAPARPRSSRAPRRGRRSPGCAARLPPDAGPAPVPVPRSPRRAAPSRTLPCRRSPPRAAGRASAAGVSEGELGARLDPHAAAGDGGLEVAVLAEAQLRIAGHVGAEAIRAAGVHVQAILVDLVERLGDSLHPVLALVPRIGAGHSERDV